MTAARDFSQLAALLAGHVEAAPAKQKPVVANARKPANDNKPARPLLAWPAFERLAYRGDVARLYALRHWRDMCFPRDMDIQQEDEAQDDVEVNIKIRPTEAQLLGAVGWTVIDRERWSHTRKMVNVYMKSTDEQPLYRTKIVGKKSGAIHHALDARIGDLIFTDGELVQWGTTSKGKARRPSERRGDEKGGAVAGRTDSEVRSYLGLKGAVSPLTAQPYMKPCHAELRDRCQPSEEAAAARKVLEDLGVDGTVAFERLPFPATRCEDGYVFGPQWVGGVKQPKPTASEPAGKEPEFVRHIETVDYVQSLRLRLGKHAKVLDLAITDTPAVDIGIAVGLAPAYAAKQGAKLIDDAIDKLIEIDETARGDFGEILKKLAA